MLLCATIAATHGMCSSLSRLISKRGARSGGFGIVASVMDVVIIVSDILGFFEWHKKFYAF